jgi:hypothetical protein
MILPEGKPFRNEIMKRSAGVVLFLLSLTCGEGLLLAQFRPEEVARRSEMETFLLTAEIVRSERAGEGVTKPWRLYLTKDGLEAQAFWKNPSGMMNAFWEGWQYEIAAYRLDKLIGLDMVPVTVERKFQGQSGALSLRAEHKYSFLTLVQQQIRIPDEGQGPVERMKWLTRAWDSLIANEDRNQQNILFTEDWRTILIDHSRAFRSSGEFTKKLMFGVEGIKRGSDGRLLLFVRLPRRFYERVKALTRESIKAAVGDTLTGKEIGAILTRRDLLIKEIDTQILFKGEANVLYD